MRGGETQPFAPRQQMRGQTYEIFHYRDTGLGRVSIHHHDFYEIYLFLEGNIEFLVEGHSFHPEPGDLLLISPLELHQLRSRAPQQPYERIVLWIAQSWINRISSPEASLTRCFDRSWAHHANLLRPGRSRQGRVTELLRGLLEENRRREYGWQAAAGGIFLQLMAEVNRLALESSPAQPPADRTEEQIQRVLAYIDRHYDEKLSLDQLAGTFFLSKYYLSHAFQRLVGASVYRYITQKRLVIAKQLLTGGVSPTDVYQNCGFRDYSNFYRTFKAEYGLSPAQFARRQRQARTDEAGGPLSKEGD